MKSYDGCQKARPIPKYKTTLGLPILSSSSVLSIDFAGTSRATLPSNRFVLVAVEYLTEWPIAKTTADSAAQVVLEFLKREIMYSIGPLQTIVSDKGTCFTASVVSRLWLGKIPLGAPSLPTLSCLMVDVVQCAGQAGTRVQRSSSNTNNNQQELPTAQPYGVSDSPFPFKWVCGPQ